MIYEYGAAGARKLTGKPEVIRVNMTQRHFVHQKFYAMCPGIEAGLSP
jgi:hypothetical protein